MRSIVTVVLCFAATACSGPAALGGGPANVRVAQAGSLPPLDYSDFTTASRDYFVGPFDKLQIDVFGVEALSKREVQTDGSGRFSFPLVGTVEAMGRTPEEVARMIEGGLRGRYVLNPQVTVNLAATGTRLVTIDGEVNSAGLYPVVGRMSLMQAIATAKGASQDAKLDDVVVFRTVKGQKMAALYNLKLIRRGVYEDPEIFPNDVVIVGDSPGRRLFDKILQMVPLVTTPLLVLVR